MWWASLMIGLWACAAQALRARGLLASAVWLAGTSALTALGLYQLGAPEVAVIELSVGAGLVIVLLVFAIHLAGEAEPPTQALLPRALVLAVLLLTLLLFSGLAPPPTFPAPLTPLPTLEQMVWQDRRLDVFLQVMLIFTGALSVLGWLGEGHKP